MLIKLMEDLTLIKLIEVMLFQNMYGIIWEISIYVNLFTTNFKSLFFLFI